MTHRSSSPPLIQGIDGIVSRHPNGVNYFAFNETKIESGKQPENKIRQKYIKYGLRKMEKYVNLIKPGNENENKMVKNNEEVNREDDVATQETPNWSNGEVAEAEAEAQVKAKAKEKREKQTVAIMPLQDYNKQRYTCSTSLWNNVNIGNKN